MTAKIILAATLLAGTAAAAAQDAAPVAPDAQAPAAQATTPPQPESASPATTSQQPAPQTQAPPQQPAPSGTAPGDTAPSGNEAAQPNVGTAPAADPVTLATAADVKPGAKVFDQKGGEVGTIESATAQGAIVSTGKARVQIALSSFGKNSSGLVIALSRAELEAAAAKAAPQGS